MVEDPEKHIHYTGQYKKFDPWQTDQTRGKNREKKKKWKRRSLQVTLIPMQTCKLEFLLS